MAVGAECRKLQTGVFADHFISSGANFAGAYDGNDSRIRRALNSDSG